MQTATSPNVARIVPRCDDPTAKAEAQHLSKDKLQAIAIQSTLCRVFLDFESTFEQTRELPLRHGIAETMTKLASTWRSICELRREILGKPRAGSLSPAERAEMRRRKSKGSSQRAPTLAKPVVAAPSVAEKA